MNVVAATIDNAGSNHGGERKELDPCSCCDCDCDCCRSYRILKKRENYKVIFNDFVTLL